MINFNALGFNVCRSEEVISFFWRSVYNYLYTSQWRPRPIWAGSDKEGFL